jgi:hypothetical protein
MLNRETLPPFPATRGNDFLTIFGFHSGTKARYSFSFPAGAV